jgi:abequosyltransferase
MNRAEYLEGLLENIRCQINGRIQDIVEIVIVDGCSTDNTKQVIEDYKDRLNITALSQNSKMGIDKDILKCIELASGKYCWLLSDDDRLCDQAIPYVIEVLDKAGEVTGIFCNRIPFNKEMTKRVNEVRQWPCRIALDVEQISSKSECFKRIGMDFGYLSSQIVRRKAWNTAISDYDTAMLDGCMYLMVDIIARMMNDLFNWKIIHRPLIKQRTGNDSILARNGIVQRQRIEHNGFEKIISLHYRKNERVYRIFNNKIISRLPRAIANIKAQNIPYSEQRSIYFLHIEKYYSYPAYWLTVLPVILIPNVVFIAVKRIYFRYWIR